MLPIMKMKMQEQCYYIEDPLHGNSGKYLGELNIVPFVEDGRPGKLAHSTGKEAVYSECNDNRMECMPEADSS